MYAYTNSEFGRSPDIECLNVPVCLCPRVRKRVCAFLYNPPLVVYTCICVYVCISIYVYVCVFWMLVLIWSRLIEMTTGIEAPEFSIHLGERLRGGRSPGVLVRARYTYTRDVSLCVPHRHLDGDLASIPASLSAARCTKFFVGQYVRGIVRREARRIGNDNATGGLPATRSSIEKLRASCPVTGFFQKLI